MKRKTLGIVAGTLMVALMGSVARAGDVEIVNPNSPPPAQSSTTTVVPTAPVQPVAVEQPTAPPVRKDVHEDVSPPHNAMATIFVSALMGGLAGVLVGGAIYYLADNQEHAARIGIWAAGGVLVGTGVGVIQVVADESRANQAVSSIWKSDPAPTYRLALFTTHF